MNLKKFILCLGLSFIVAACSGPSPNLMRSSENGPQIDTEGIVVMKIYGNSPGGFLSIGKGDTGLWTAVQQEKGQGHFYLFGRKKEPEIFHIQAGTYFFNFFSNGAVVRVREPIPEFGFDAETDVPISPFTVNPGEAVYLGTLVVHGIRHEQVVGGPTPQITYEVIDETEYVRAFLAKEYPSFADKMVTRLFTIVGGGNKYVPETAEKE